jgi:hypothetical protein
VTVYVVEANRLEGVPEITPEAGSSVIPLGRAGEIAHVVTAPPVFVGVNAVIATVGVPTKLFGEYAITGAPRI